MVGTLRSVLSFGVACCFAGWVRATCFDINGIQDLTAIPCNPQAQHSTCCLPGWICLSNNLCQQGPQINATDVVPYHRGWCTDPTWNTSQCFSGCNSFGGSGISSCGRGYGCCFNYFGCNCSQASVYLGGVGTAVTTISLFTKSSQTTATSTTGDSIPGNPNPIIPTTIADSSGILKTLATNNSSMTDSLDKAGLSTGAKVGIGAGIAAGMVICVAIGAGGVLLHFRRRRISAEDGRLIDIPLKPEMDARPKTIRRKPLPQRHEVPATHTVNKFNVYEIGSSDHTYRK